MSEEIKEENPVDPIELSIFKEHIENNFLNFKRNTTQRLILSTQKKAAINTTIIKSYLSILICIPRYVSRISLSFFKSLASSLEFCFLPREP